MILFGMANKTRRQAMNFNHDVWLVKFYIFFNPSLLPAEQPIFNIRFFSKALITTGLDKLFD